MGIGADSSSGYAKNVVPCTTGSYLTTKKNRNNTKVGGSGKYYIAGLYIIIIYTCVYVCITLNGTNHEESRAKTHV